MSKASKFIILSIGIAATVGLVLHATKANAGENVIEFVEGETQSVFHTLTLGKLTTVNDPVYEKAKQHVMSREGYRLDVYLDSLHKPTVGYGHLLTPSSGLVLGDVITPEQAEKFLDEDLKKAYNHAKNQAAELGLSGNSDFVIALTSVNFQLGTNWRSKFPSAWKHLKAKQYDDAIAEIMYTRKGSGVYSSWYKQTSTRVDDFVLAIQQLKWSS